MIGAVEEAARCGTRRVGTQHLLLAAIADPVLARIGAPIGLAAPRMRELTRSVVGIGYRVSSEDVGPDGVQVLEHAAEVLERARALTPATGPDRTAALRHAVLRVLLDDDRLCVARLLLGDVDRARLRDLVAAARTG